ncbi:MAG: 4-phosphopantoate--beta-alanine ligase [Candidatus Thermoplasmatota archaeon]|nr:4-phosphopantoate--beta-alanine ligase [Candidatus Thermoplasmatota archaeon]
MSFDIPCNHPRYESLMIRQRLADGLKDGLVHETGLIAHGRGEAFDYLIGERTIDVAFAAEKVASAWLLLAKHPVISVNGNVAALVPDECVRLAKTIPAALEVNLFHRTEERIQRLVNVLQDHGAETVLGEHALEKIPGLDHARGICERQGIYAADVVLVPLEDGDRCQALKKMGKCVITIDLNPLSRTARTADITIVDNVCRAMGQMVKWVEELHSWKKKELEDLCRQWDNKGQLHAVVEFISKRLKDIK